VSTAMGCIMRLGIGSRELLDSRPQLVAEHVRYNAPHGESSLCSKAAPGLSADVRCLVMHFLAA
jgi:hypothetical protein